jgi:Flp pilus assembly protein TadB
VRISGEAPETLAPLSALEELARELHALREVVENQGMLLRDQAHRLKRLEAASRLPATLTEAPKKASLEMLDGTNKSSAEDQKDGEDNRQPSTSRNASLGILLVMLLTLSVVITVISALYMNALLLTVSFVVVEVSLLFSWYYYSYG